MPANRIQLQSALQKPYDRFFFAKEILKPIFNTYLTLHASLVKPSVQPNQSESAVIDNVGIYGKISLEDSTEITCYEITLKPNVRLEYSKVAIQHYVRKLLTAGQAALINFISPIDNSFWRFTLVAKDSVLTETGIKEKATNSKRYTYLLGPSETCKTAAERFESLSIENKLDLDILVKAFSVEKLSKAFFDEYTRHYENFIAYLTKPANKKSLFNGDEKAIRDYSKKLLGRIVFLYFVQKKRWLGASDTNYKNGMTDFIMQLFHLSGSNSSFYPNWLTKLFFDTLNNERKEDDFEMPDGKKVKIPFLNGGLFDKEEHDDKIIPFPANLFHNHDNEEDPKERGFLDFLNAFNFTIYEDSPDEKTVAVDPEMLGHIFENLLEDNKDKGAFYTPKEIVHYMCQESLIEYLSTHLSKEYTVFRSLGNDQIEFFGNETRVGQLSLLEQMGDKTLNRDDVYNIVKSKDISRLTKEQLTRIDQLLSSVKICDPAIGSGAFPMGLLQEIYSIKEVIAYETGKEWKPAEVKENIIQNSIYGVDIEKGAVDIARLRFWLSLVVDEEKPKPLPNLDYKIVVGDSLVSKFDGEVVEIEWTRTKSAGKGDDYLANIKKLLLNVAEKQRKFFHPDLKNKKKLTGEIRNLKIELLINQLSFNKLNYINKNSELIDSGFGLTAKEKTKNAEIKLEIAKYDNLLKKLNSLKKQPDQIFYHFDWKLDFPEVLNPYLVGDNSGFDIVIGNPPYYQLRELSENLQDQYKESIYFEYAKGGRLNVFQFFIPFAIMHAKYEAIICLITQNSILGEDTAINNRRFIFSNTEVIRFDSYPERDNVQKRVFENVKMSVAITLLRKKVVADNYFSIWVWKEKQMLNKSELIISKKEIFQLYPENLIVPSVSQVTIKMLKRILQTPNCFYVDSSAGEVDMTKYKTKFNLRGQGFRVYTGAQIQRYYITNDPSQGDVVFLDKSKTPKYGKFNFIERERIAMQRITGVDSPIRLIMTLIPPNTLCANSVNFITANTHTELCYLLGVLNSNLVNKYYKFTSTNTNITTSEINRIPIPSTSNFIKNLMSSIVDYILFLKSGLKLEYSNGLIHVYFEQIIDGIVYELYFPEILKKHNREIIKHLGELPAITEKMTDQQKIEIIREVFNRLNTKEHPVRVNLFYMDSIPEIRIIEGKDANN